MAGARGSELVTAMAPHAATLRMYDAGFGDCFLVSFQYSGEERHLLIDFGSAGSDRAATAHLLMRIARDIYRRTGGKLHGVVATHRHSDHIGGFAGKKNGGGPGDLIAACDPEVVIQPWTEDPAAEPGEAGPFARRLHDLHLAADAVLDEVKLHGDGLTRAARREIEFLGADNLSNRRAVEGLAAMGRRHCYVSFGSDAGLADALPGVTVRVLGPPTLAQHRDLAGHRPRDAEYWHMSEFWPVQAAARQFAASGGRKLFPRADIDRLDGAPPHARWFLRRLRAVRGEQLLGIVRLLDAALNNTSVILLIEFGRRKLLFPGDAQIESWEFALAHADVRRALRDVDVYKVGHHGSLNGTPRSLWEGFRKRSPKEGAERLVTLLATQAGKHGDSRAGTEVPRGKLVAALRAGSHVISTEDFARGEAYRDLTIAA